MQNLMSSKNGTGTCDTNVWRGYVGSSLSTCSRLPHVMQPYSFLQSAESWNNNYEILYSATDSSYHIARPIVITSLPHIYFTIIMHTVNYTLFCLLNNTFKKKSKLGKSHLQVFLHQSSFITSDFQLLENSLQKVAHCSNPTSACVRNLAIERPIFIKLNTTALPMRSFSLSTKRCISF